jgi:hypothetical protein
MWDYGLVVSQISRGVAADKHLSAATLVLCLVALSKLEYRERWRNDDEPLIDTEWDTIEGYLDGAYNDLLTEISYEGTDLQLAVLTYEVSEGVNGATITADTERQIPLNTEYDPYGIVSLHGSNEILLDAGKYYVDGTCILYGAARAKTWLTGPENERFCQGTNRDVEDGHIHIKGIIDVDGATDLIWSIKTNPWGTFGRYYDFDVSEIYAQISFLRLGDSD